MDLSSPLLLDGATGTELIKRGYDKNGKCAEAWVLEHPEAIRELQSGYVDAGSRVIYAPTFGANRVILSRHGLGERVRDFNRRLVALSREAAGDKALVAGDISPTGLMLSPLGEASFEELYDIYREQAEALAEAEVDLFVIETMMTLPEARAALLAVKDVSDRPVFVSFTCDGNGRTLTGTDVTAALTVMEGMGADVFGLNCSHGPREMGVQLRRLSELTDLPLLAKPNAGLPKNAGGETVYDCPPEEFAALTAEMAKWGVRVFGGCCGTDRNYIAALRKELNRMTLPEKESAASVPALASERRRFALSEITDEGETVLCDADLEEALDGLEGNGTELLTLTLTDEDGAEALAECQYAIARPVCFRCGDAGLLEKALRVYQGRAGYRGELNDAALTPLVKKYGLVRL